MKQLKQKAKEIKEKQSWIRKGVQEFLDLWKEATSECLDVERLEEQPITSTVDEDPMCGVKEYTEFVLVRGRSAIKIYEYNSEAPRSYSEKSSFEYADHEKGYKRMDFEHIRTILTELKGAVERYLKKFNEEIEDHLILKSNVRDLLG